MRGPPEVQLETDKLLAEVAGPIGWVTFNQPDRHNAMSLEMWEGLARALDAFGADPAVRVVVMRGAGDEAFVSGADISQFESERRDAEAARSYRRQTAEGWGALARLEKPLVAMIRGYCMGGGLAIALHADIRIAGEDACFAIPAARLGLGYDYEAVRSLVSIVGPAWATEILMTARRYTAEEALRMGLVTRVVAAAELDDAVRETAARIAQNAPLTVRATKLILRQVLADPENRDLALARELVRRCFDSEDYAEGRRAFLEKRKPVFQGR